MGEYIERKAATEALLDVYEREFPTADGAFDLFATRIMPRTLRNVPAADVEPVRHGQWEWLGPNELVRGFMCGSCSACKVRSKYIVNRDICPNCGARMDGGGADNGE